MKKFLIDLGLDPDKQHSVAEVKSAWRKRVKETHPDQGGDEEEFKKVMHAYNMITDPAYRTEAQQKEQEKKMDLDIRIQVPIAFEQAFVGTDFHLNYNIAEMDEAGVLIKKDLYDIESIHLKIKKGSMHGDKFSFKEKGIIRGKERGDVDIEIMVQPHPKFRADDHGNILSIERIPLDLLLKGGKYDVQTMIGIRTLKLKPGTRPGDRIAIKKCGALGADHIIICEPLFPTQEDLKTEAWKGLDVNWTINEEVLKEQEEESGWQRRYRGGGVKFKTAGL
jgi:DnaJ-class molecular chaperone